MSKPDILPSQDTVEAAWQAYTDLVRARQESPALETDLSHSIATARAWNRWQHLFLAREAA